MRHKNKKREGDSKEWSLVIFAPFLEAGTQTGKLLTCFGGAKKL